MSVINSDGMWRDMGGSVRFPSMIEVERILDTGPRR
jgi:hypothetical protein